MVRDRDRRKPSRWLQWTTGLAVCTAILPVSLANAQQTPNAALAVGEASPTGAVEQAPEAPSAPPSDRPIAPPSPPRVVPSPAAESPIAERTIAPPSGSFSGDAIRTLVALVAVVAIALVLRQVVRRLGDPLAARRPSGVVQILSRFPFAKHQQIVLMQVGRRVVVVHQAASATTTLCEIVDPDEVAELRARIEAGSGDRVRFDSELSRSLERGEPGRSGGRPIASASNQATETVDLTRRGGRLAALGLGPTRLGASGRLAQGAAS